MSTKAVGSYGVVVESRPGNNVFHDLIKSIIKWDAPTIYEISKTIPSLKSSNLLKDKWVLEPEYIYQEHATDTTHRSNVKMDCVWLFHKRDNPSQTYRLTHEVKTGRFDVDEIKEKYYWWQDSQIWIWGQECYTPPKNELPRLVRFAPIECLWPIIKLNITAILSSWGNDE